MGNQDTLNRIKEPTPAAQQNGPFGIWSTETATEKGFKVMLYGASGSGKTYMAGTFPDPLFLDLEDGMRTLLPLKRRILRYPKDPLVSITEFKEVKAFFQLVKKTPPSQAPFKTIVIDSLNELQVLVMKNLMSEHQANRLYEDQPTISDYGKLARDMQGIVRGFLQLPYHIVMTAAATDKEYEDDKCVPMFVGKKTGPDLRRIIEQVGYCYTAQKSKGDPVEHLVSFNDCPAFHAKDRTSKLKRPFANNFSTMMDIINKEPTK